MQRERDSPIAETLDTWPLAGAYQLRWGRDVEGELWVSVENRLGVCQDVLPYKTYLEMEGSRAAGH